MTAPSHDEAFTSEAWQRYLAASQNFFSTPTETHRAAVIDTYGTWAENFNGPDSDALVANLVARLEGRLDAHMGEIAA